MTEFLPCTRRQPFERFEKGGQKTPLNKCAHPLSVRFTKLVEPLDCRACALRAEFPLRGILVDPPKRPREFAEPVLEEDGSLRYPKTSVEPPPAHDGYRRRDEDVSQDGAWEFVSEFVPCLDRQMANYTKPNGALQINAYCVSDESGYKGRQITAEICAACPVRRSDGQVVKQH